MTHIQIAKAVKDMAGLGHLKKTADLSVKEAKFETKIKEADAPPIPVEKFETKINAEDEPLIEEIDDYDTPL